MESEEFQKKEYLSTLTPTNARQMFKYRSKMYDVKFNYKNDKKYSNELWKCDSCQTCIESQDHVLFCPAYATLREGKDLFIDKDLSEYLTKVITIRDKLKLKK